jgi:hypothetical protein
MTKKGKGGAGHGVAWTTQQPPEGLRVRNSPAIRVRIVPCPECGAGVGEACITSNGKPLYGAHRSRRRLSIRTAREQSEKEQEDEG